MKQGIGVAMTEVFSWREAIQLSELPAPTRHVLLNLSIYMNDKGGNCFPSVELQAKDTGLSKRSVITHLQIACDKGFLVKTQHGYAGQKWKRSEYQATYPKVCTLKREIDETEVIIVQLEHEQKGGERDAPIEKKVVNVVQEGGERSDIKVVQEVHTNSSYNSPKNSPGKKPKKVSLEEFDKLSPGWEYTLKNWCQENKVSWSVAIPIIRDFRENIKSGGNLYADFASAFKVWLRKGYLSVSLGRAQQLSVQIFKPVTLTEKGLSL